MKLIADLHTHTIASNHAFSTLFEMTEQAKSMGLLAIAVTDHAPGMPDAPHPYYFGNIVHLPDQLPNGLFLLKGAEVNVINVQGELDLSEKARRRLDWVIVSLHQSCLAPLSYEEATNLWLSMAETAYVDMIGHSEQQEFLYDYERVTKAFAKNNKVVELNANSAKVRPGNEENMRRLALCCKQNKTRISVNSDAHSIYDIGNTIDVLQILKEIDFPEALVINSSLSCLMDALSALGRAYPNRIAHLL